MKRGLLHSKSRKRRKVPCQREDDWRGYEIPRNCHLSNTLEGASLPHGGKKHGKQGCRGRGGNVPAGKGGRVSRGKKKGVAGRRPVKERKRKARESLDGFRLFEESL